MSPSVTSPATPNDITALIAQTGCKVQNIAPRNKCLPSLITGVAFAIIALALGVVLACGIAHPVIITGLVLALIISGVALALALREHRRPPIPQGFLNIIKKAYPKVIYDLCVHQKLTLQELRLVLQHASSGNFYNAPSSIKAKLEKVDLDGLVASCQGVHLPSLEDLLLEHCPWFLINTFINNGSKYLCEAENLPGEVYWPAPLALYSGCNRTAFHPYMNLVAKHVQCAEYTELLEHAKNNTWDQGKHILDRIFGRIYEDSCYQESNRKHVGMYLNGQGWLLGLLKHGVSWEQVKLFRKVDLESLILLDNLNSVGRCSSLLYYVASVHSHIQENNPEGFEHDLALMTWEELKTGYQRYSEKQKSENRYDSFMKFLASLVRNKNSSFKVYALGKLLPVSYNDLDYTTGRRSNRTNM